jgi:transglycosylase-like protein with SLT domain
MGRVRSALAAAAVGAAITASGAAAQTTPDPTTTTTTTAPPPDPSPQPQPLPPPTAQLIPKKPPRAKTKPPSKPSKPPKKPGKGGSKPPKGKGGGENEKGASPNSPAPPPLPPLSAAPGACGPIAVPAYLSPIYQAAAQAYDLGPAGPSILAAINEIESGFGQNLGPSSAGAVGWMQFMPSTWVTYGVDANGDGIKDPNNPNDAIFAAARYLRAAGMPEDPEGAVFSYNHADWYVQEVMARAACFNGIGIGGLSLIPERQELVCATAKDASVKIPDDYIKAFQEAAGRYDLGENGVWALAAVARVESNFGKGMSAEQLRTTGPLGITQDNWRRYAVDGDGNGKVTHRSPADSAATLARMIWAAGDLRAGLFQHNHAEWYVDAVLKDAQSMAGTCQVKTVAYSVALPGPTNAAINWSNVQLSNQLEMMDIQSGAIDPRILDILGAISQQHTVLISALRSDHPKYTTNGSISNHYYGRAMDIAAIDGVSCTDVSPTGPCGTVARELGALPPGQEPTELIYCFDPDGPNNPNGFAEADHCNHIHVGFDS